MHSKSKVLLLILDGFGINNDQTQGNAILNAKTPNLDKLFTQYPNSLLQTSGKAVGLPDGQMGNSEIGHSTIGTGRMLKSSLTQINDSIKKNQLSKMPNLQALLKREDVKIIHLIGLYSFGGVHSDAKHLHSLIKILNQKNKLPVLHLISDGRDTDVDVFSENIFELINKFKDINVNLATICGRYYAMDRDNRKDRTQLATNLIVNGIGKKIANAPNSSKGISFKEIEKFQVPQHIKDLQKASLSDEFIPPTVLGGFNGIKNKEGIIFFNFRTDRMKQISLDICQSMKIPIFKKQNKQLHVSSDIDEIKIQSNPSLSMTNYFTTDQTSPSVFPIFYEQNIQDTLGEVLSKNSIKQLRIAETEKYPHVTYFFNANKGSFQGEERILIPSPKVKTYDKKPEMSGEILTETIIKKMDNNYGLIVANFANCDMVGHTGNFKASKDAVECIDSYIGKIITEAKQKNYITIITADHGNAEEMIGKNGKINTKHTTNPVPFILISSSKNKIRDGSLQDIAPTILQIMNIKKPNSFKGKSLIKNK